MAPGYDNMSVDRPTSLPDEQMEAEEVRRLDQSLPPFVEIGSTGLKRSAGYIDEEFLPQLRGRKAVQVFKEMSENDPLVGSIIHTVTMLLRNVEWTVKPGGKSKEDAKIADLVETSMHDMTTTWDDFITEALSMLVYGWSWHEVVYKRRGGLWQKNPRLQSKHTDGLIGWRRIPIRAQETMVRWVFDDAGEIVGMVQMPPPSYKQIILPYDRSVLFRYRHSKGNPEGRSMLRNAYRPWYMKKRIEELEAIGIERDLAGLPIVKVPAHFLRAKPGSEQRKTVDEFRKLIKSLRRNEQEGLVFPNAFDQDTKQPLYSLELLGSGGARSFNTDSVIQRYEQRILMSVLADFIMVGHQGTGSYSMHTDKTGIFRNTLNSIAQGICDTMNRTVLPKLVNLNGWRPESLPEIVPTDVDAPDIGQLAQFMTSMAGLGVQWFPDPAMDKFIRDAARLPQLDDDAEKVEEQLSDMQQSIKFAQKQTEYLQSKQAMDQASNPAMPGPTAPGQPVDQAAADEQASQQEEQGQVAHERSLEAEAAKAPRPGAGKGGKR